MDPVKIYFYDYIDEEECSMPLFGLFSVLSYLKYNSKSNFEIFSFINIDDIHNIIPNEENVFVVMSIISSLNFYEIERILIKIREIKNKKFKVVIGGYGVHLIDEISLTQTWPEIDFLIIGKGEILFQKIIEGEITKNGIYKNTHVIENYSVVCDEFLQKLNKIDYVPVVVRGTDCKWAKCEFCAHIYYSGKANYGPYKTFQMIKHYYDKGFKNIYLVDNWVDFDHLYETLDYLYDEGILDIKFKSVGCNINSNWKRMGEYIEKFGRNIFEFLIWGIEWLDDDVLKVLNKGITVEKIFQHAKMLKSWNVPLNSFVLFGLPLITDEQIKQVYDKFLEYDPYVDLYCPSFYRLIPNSNIFNNPEKWKIDIIKQQTTHRTVYPVLEKYYEFKIYNPSNNTWAYREQNMLRYTELANLTYSKSDSIKILPPPILREFIKKEKNN